MEIEFFKWVVDKLPIRKLYGRIRLYCIENIEIRFQLRRGKRTQPDTFTGFIWETNRKGEKRGPYCPECWYNKKQRILLIETINKNVYKCNSCNKYKYPANYKINNVDTNDDYNYWV